MKTLTKSMVFVVSLNALVLAAFAMWVWCEVAIFLGENPMAEMFILVVVVPALLVFGVILLALGGRFQIPLLNRLIPFIGVIVFFVSGLLLGFFAAFFPSLDQYLLGACIGIALSILTIVTTLRIVRSRRNGGQASQVE